MLELSWKGTKPLLMPDGSERKFIKDGDTVIMKAHSKKDGVRVGFGEVSTQVLPQIKSLKISRSQTHVLHGFFF